MTHPVTLTTDFGPGSAYVAAMKGALLAVQPGAVIVDLSHRVPPQDLRYTAYFLRAAVPYFPAGTLHVVVVDPGVGSERPILYVEWQGQKLLVPDNGCWTGLLAEGQQPARVIRLTERRFWRPTVSATFHGRDIFAPVAGHLSRGVDPAELGPVTDQWQSLDLPRPQLGEAEIVGEVVFRDDFGNLLTNIPADAYRRWAGGPVEVLIDSRPVTRRVRTYSEAPPGEPVVLVSSVETVEIAVNHGSAAATLGLDVGAVVQIRPQYPSG